MKTIYLLRHAKSSWDDPDLADIDRPLSERGRRAAEAMAVYLAEAAIRPHLVLCSSAKRTRSTLKRVAPALGGTAPAVIEEGLYEADADGLLRRLRVLDDGLASVMMIGHNPALEELARRLTGDGEEEALRRMDAKFPTGALAVLTADVAAWRDLGPAGARLTAFVTPRDID